jgi:hypothetical protein
VSSNGCLLQQLRSRCSVVKRPPPPRAEAIRGIRTRPGHGFALLHEPEEGLYHVAISYRPADNCPLSKNQKNELKLALLYPKTRAASRRLLASTKPNRPTAA